MSEENIKICKEILKQLKKLRKVPERPDIWLLVDELEEKVKWLKVLHDQIIP